MHYIFEAIFVGAYSYIIAIILSFCIIHKYYKYSYLLLFWTGFIKHFSGYLLGIQTYYCNYGCYKERKYQKNRKAVNNTPGLIIESILEGIIYIVIGTIITQFITYKHLLSTVFFTGLIIHILSELLGFHTYFCKNRCSV